MAYGTWGVSWGTSWGISWGGSYAIQAIPDSSGGGGKRKKKYKDFAPDPSKARQALGDFREELALKRQREFQVEIALKKQEVISADKRAEKLIADGWLQESAQEKELAIRLEAERREEEEFMVLLLMMAS